MNNYLMNIGEAKLITNYELRIMNLKLSIMSNSSQFARFFGILRRMQGANKEEIIWQYSNLLTTSLKEFATRNPNGFLSMLDDLEMKFPQQPATETTKSYDPELKKLRSAVLLRIQKHGVDTTNWKEVNAFLKSDRIAGKYLYEMSNDELRKLIAKLELILLKDAKEQSQKRWLAQNN